MESGRLLIQRGHARSGTQGLAIGESKTEVGRRTIAFDPQMVKVLKQHRKQQGFGRRRAARDGHLEEGGFMFASEHGGPLDPDSFSATFRGPIKMAGLHPIRLHDLRHTLASHLISIGMSPPFIQYRLGHANFEIMLGTCGHLFSAMEADDVEGVADQIYLTADGGTP